MRRRRRRRSEERWRERDWGLRKYAPLLCLNGNCQSWREKGQPGSQGWWADINTHAHTDSASHNDMHGQKCGINPILNA